MAENIIGKDLVTLYRGQPMLGESRYLKMLNQGLPSPGSNLNLNKKDLSKLAGQYYSKSLGTAKSYAGPFGKIKSMTVPSNYLDKFNKFQTSVTNLPSGKFTQAGAGGGSNYLVPKSALKTFNPSVDYAKTFKNIVTSNNPFAGFIDEAKMLYPSYMGEGYTKLDKGLALGKNISNMGLGFLRNNALRTLAILSSLPAQAGLMTFSPTKMGNAELPQMPKGPPSIINQGGDGGGGVKDSGGPTGGYSYDGGGRQGFGYGLAMGGFI
tara:strand:- start:44 stop:841 length:798 start_codon:yes stop_codon:yes gene_type:complete